MLYVKYIPLIQKCTGPWTFPRWSSLFQNWQHTKGPSQHHWLVPLSRYSAIRPSECIWIQTTIIKNKTKQVAFTKNLSCVLSAGCKATLRFSTVLSTDWRLERIRPSFPFQILSQTTCWVTLISGQIAIPRNDGIFSVHKDIVPNVFFFFPSSSIYNCFLLLNGRLIWILTICQFQHTSPINISFLGREEAQMMWSWLVL